MGKVARFRDVERCLWEAFSSTNSPDSVQQERYLWVIRECMERSRSFSGQAWRETKARKVFACVRGCEIKPGHFYYKPGTATERKLCAGCMAMIFFYQRLYLVPPEFYTHWDWELQTPVWKEDEYGR